MTIQNVGSISFDEPQFLSAIHQAAALRRDERGRPVAPDERIDAYNRIIDAEAIETLRTRRDWKPDPQLVADYRADCAERNDALGAGAPGFPRDFEYVRREVMAMERPVLNSELLVAPDRSVPLGATVHTMRRAVTAGHAEITRGTTRFPAVSAQYLEEQFPVVYIVSSVRVNFFTQLSTDYAGLNQFRTEADTAVRVVRERMNRIAWGGDAASGLYGILNYPHMPKAVLSTLFDGSATGPAVVAEIIGLLNTPRVTSKGVFYPNRLVVSETLYTYLTTTQMAAGQDTTIAQFIVNTQAGRPNGIKRIEVAWELEANSSEMQRAGAPANYHGILAYNDALSSMRQVIVQEPTFLAPHRENPLSTLHVVFAAYGGIVQPNVGGNILGFARA